MEEKQTKFTIMEGHTLPSGGKIYGQKVNPNVELRAMTGRDEMKRLSKSNTPLKVLADLIEGCMLEKPAVHVYDMALGDYEFLLHKLRTITYGPDYPMTVRCIHCDTYEEVSVNLDELVVREIDFEKFEQDSTVTLPESKDIVAINFQTPHLTDAISNKAKDMSKKFKNASVDFETRAKLLLTINSINDAKLSEFELENYLDNMHAKDFRYLLSAIDKLNVNFGIETLINVKCPNCGGENAVFFRYGPEFLGPTNF